MVWVAVDMHCRHASARRYLLRVCIGLHRGHPASLLLREATYLQLLCVNHGLTEN